MKSQEYRSFVLDKLIYLERKVELSGSLSYRDINIDCENFYRDLLNILFKLNLENSNNFKANHETFDLADKTNRRAYQVTSSVNRDKVNKTIDGFGKYRSDYDELFILFVRKKDPLKSPKRKKIGKFKSNFSFDVDKHLLDNTDIIREFENKGIDDKKEVYDLLKKYFEGSDTHQKPIEVEEFNELVTEWKEFYLESEIDFTGKTIKGASISKALCQLILDSIRQEMIYLGRNLFVKKHEEIPDLFFWKVIEAHSGGSLWILADSDGGSYHGLITEKVAELKDGLASRGNYNDKWEFVKWYFESQNFESREMKEALRATGSVLFYNQSGEERLSRYQRAIGVIWRDYGNYLNGLVQYIRLAIEMIDSGIHKKQFVRKINLRFHSGFDVLLLLYMVLYKHDSFTEQELASIQKYFSFDRLISENMRSYMIDSPDDEQVKGEICLALSDVRLDTWLG